jgi:hypothetical protein
MSTNSAIIVRHPTTGVYASIYVHSDGYLEHNGVILQRCFTTLDQVLALVSLGDLSYLGNSYETALSYYRWRQESIKINVSHILEDHADLEYNYLFRDGAWHVKYHNHGWQPLAPLVEKMPMPHIADTSGRWDGKTRYIGQELTKLVGWAS